MWLFFFWLSLAIVTLLGILAGLGKAKFSAAPLIATAVIVAGYAALLLGVGAWARSCWECSTGGGGDADRRVVLLIAILFPGFVATINLVLIWAGAWLSTLIWHQAPLKGTTIVLGCVTFAVAVFGLVMLFST